MQYVRVVYTSILIKYMHMYTYIYIYNYIIQTMNDIMLCNNIFASNIIINSASTACTSCMQTMSMYT